MTLHTIAVLVASGVIDQEIWLSMQTISRLVSVKFEISSLISHKLQFSLVPSFKSDICFREIAEKVRDCKGIRSPDGPKYSCEG